MTILALVGAEMALRQVLPAISAGQICLSSVFFPTENAVLTKFQFHVTKKNTGQPSSDPLSCSAFTTLGNYHVKIHSLTCCKHSNLVRTAMYSLNDTL